MTVEEYIKQHVGPRSTKIARAYCPDGTPQNKWAQAFRAVEFCAVIGTSPHTLSKMKVVGLAEQLGGRGGAHPRRPCWRLLPLPLAGDTQQERGNTLIRDESDAVAPEWAQTLERLVGLILERLDAWEPVAAAETVKRPERYRERRKDILSILASARSPRTHAEIVRMSASPPEKGDIHNTLYRLRREGKINSNGDQWEITATGRSLL